MSSKSQGVGGVKVPSVLLTLTGIAIVAIQTYVFISFKDAIADSYGPFALYNGMAMASGIVSCLAGISALCCTASKRRSSLGFNIFMAVFSAIAAAGSATLSAMESSRIHSKDSQHPCSSIIEEDSSINSSDCNLWFDLQVSVAALSIFAFILSLILIIAISVALSKSKKKSKRSTVQVPDPVIVQEMEHIPSPVVVVNMPVIVEEIESIVPELKEIEVAEEPEEEEINTSGTNTNNSRQPYIEQLKMLSREELERRLGEHMQQQFLEELRSELNRRNLIPINGRQISRSSSGSSSHRVSSKTVPVAPRPDYYHEDYL